MNRTVLRQALRTSGVAVGEVLVTTMIQHPERGAMSCPAAPLVASEVARAGIRVRQGDVRVARGAQAILFVTSYVARDGAVTAIGAAANPRDGMAVAAAERAVEAWSGVLRTRRVLRAAADPLCAGARRALDMTEKTGSCYVYGDLPGYRGRDVTWVRDLSEVPSGASVVFPAHGVSLAVRAEAAARDLRVVDATCPIVETAQAAVRDFTGEGDTVAVVGRRGHAAAESLVGQAPERAVLTETAAPENQRLAGRVSFVLQPGVPTEELLPIGAALRARYQARPAHPGGWCYEASDRAATLRAVAAESDLLLILGDPGATDTTAVSGLVSPARAQVVTDADQLRPEWMAGVTTVGLAETLTTRPATVDRVISALSGLGPVSVAERRQVTRTVPAVSAMPRQPESTAAG